MNNKIEHVSRHLILTVRCTVVQCRKKALVTSSTSALSTELLLSRRRAQYEATLLLMMA